MSDESRIVVIGASAGGVDALLTLARMIPRTFAAPICIVLHVAPDSPSLLAKILDHQGTLPAKNAENDETPTIGTIYVAPPDRHLLIGRDGALKVTRGPRENHHRPAIDPLFRSAALHYGRRAIGVILSGALDDGTAGLIALEQCGGITVVQDPSDALYPSMPQSALEQVAADHIAPANRIAPLLTYILEHPPAPDTQDDEASA